MVVECVRNSSKGECEMIHSYRTVSSQSLLAELLPDRAITLVYDAIYWSRTQNHCSIPGRYILSV